MRRECFDPVYNELLLDIDISEVGKYLNHVELLPTNSRDIQPTKMYLSLQKKFHNILKRDSQRCSELYVNQVIFDVFSQQNRKEKIEDFGFCLDVKPLYGGSRPWKLIYEMKLCRSKRGNKNYGILTDSEVWEFFYLDENNKIFTSKCYDFRAEKKEIWNFIDFIINEVHK